MARGRILVIDSGAVREALLDVLCDIEYVERAAASGHPDPLARAGGGTFDAVVADVSGGSPWSLRMVDRIKTACPDLPLIVVRDERTPEVATSGIYDILRAPVDADSLRRAVLNAVDKHRLLVENRALMRRLNGAAKSMKARPENVAPLLVGESLGIRQVRDFIAEVAPTDMTVLIAGESGTGKEVVARAIHSMSGRSAQGSLVKINCPAVPESLLESELFGHESGAFTGAGDRKPGRLEIAAGGTAFLDEIGEIPMSVQAKLLQVIEHKHFTRLGATDTLALDARFVAATNIQLREQIAAKKFRKDLFFRLNQYVIQIPPLRDRVEDIPLLVDHFLGKYGPKYGRDGLALSGTTMGLLVRHPWPGNVRELESALQCYALTGREELISEKLAGNGGAAPGSSPGTYRQCERQLIMSTLVEAKWNRRRAAEMLGMSYNTLRRRIAQYSLDNQIEQFPFGASLMKIGAGDLQ